MAKSTKKMFYLTCTGETECKIREMGYMSLLIM
jgi:hypothetical protein